MLPETIFEEIKAQGYEETKKSFGDLVSRSLRLDHDLYLIFINLWEHDTLHLEKVFNIETKVDYTSNYTQFSFRDYHAKKMYTEEGLIIFELYYQSIGFLDGDRDVAKEFSVVRNLKKISQTLDKFSHPICTYSAECDFAHLFPIELWKYTNNSILFEFFEKNKFIETVPKTPVGCQFVDLEIETI